MASNCWAHPSSSVGSGSSRVPRMITRRGSTMRSMSARSTPAKSTQMRMDFSHRYALIAGSHVCGANCENCKRDMVGNRDQIEHHHVGKHPFLEKSAMIVPQICCRQSTQPSNCFLHWNHFLVADIFAQHSCEISIGARMRIGFQEYALRRLGSFI